MCCCGFHDIDSRCCAELASIPILALPETKNQPPFTVECVHLRSNASIYGRMRPFIHPGKGMAHLLSLCWIWSAAKIALSALILWCCTSSTSLVTSCETVQGLGFWTSLEAQIPPARQTRVWNLDISRSPLASMSRRDEG